MIKTTGKEKNYELIEYISNVNTQYTQVLMELNENGAMDAAYTYGVSRLTEDRFTGESNFYLYDPAGNVAGITDQDGYLWQSYRYDAFGNATFGSPQYDNEYTFNAESYNPNIHSQHLRARYYDTVKGSFLTEDSYLGDIKNPLTLNRYSYCIGNPLFYVDPSGHEINPFAASALTGNKKAIEAKNQLISQGDKWAEGVTQEHQEGLNQFMDDTYGWFGEHTVRHNDILTGQINNNITAGVAGSFYNTADMITSPEYLAANVYHVAAHPLQTLDRINVNGADVLNGVMGIADQIRNKEYGALARGGGYVAGSAAQVYLLRKGVRKCGDWIDTKTYKPESFAKFMSPEDAKAYLKFLEEGSTAGLTDAERLGIQKVDDALALNKLNYGSPVILQNPQIEGTNPRLNYNLQFFAGENVEISIGGGSSVVQSEFNKLLNSDYYKTDFGYDCSEIAQDFYDVAGQRGKIYRIEGKSGYINGYEYNYKMEYVYHEVYSDGTYIYDPRYKNVPVLKDDYFRALREINPDGFDVFEIME